MTRRAVALAVLGSMFVAAHSQNQPGPPFQPKEGFVPNAETAVKIAEAVLIPVYGEKQVFAERPFKATLERNIWTVAGTLHCDPPGALCHGGTAEVKISKSSGQILHMIHYK